MYTTQPLEVVVDVEPPDEPEQAPREVEVIDENDMPSSSRSMSLLIEEAAAAIERYTEGEQHED